MFILILPDKPSPHPLLGRLFFVTDHNHYRKPQTKYRAVVISPYRYISNINSCTQGKNHWRLIIIKKKGHEFERVQGEVRGRAWKEEREGENDILKSQKTKEIMFLNVYVVPRFNLIVSCISPLKITLGLLGRKQMWRASLFLIE